MYEQVVDQVIMLMELIKMFYCKLILLFQMFFDHCRVEILEEMVVPAPVILEVER